MSVVSPSFANLIDLAQFPLRYTAFRSRCQRRLAVLAHHTEPGIALSELARMTLYGRLGG